MKPVTFPFCQGSIKEEFSTCERIDIYVSTAPKKVDNCKGAIQVQWHERRLHLVVTLLLFAQMDYHWRPLLQEVIEELPSVKRKPWGYLYLCGVVLLEEKHHEHSWHTDGIQHAGECFSFVQTTSL